MVTSYKKRFEGKENEIVEYVKAWGIFKAMDRYEASDLVAFKKFLSGETDDANVGLSPIFVRPENHTVGEQLVDAFAAKLLRLTELNEALKRENTELRNQLELMKAREVSGLEPKLRRLAVLCE
jgi:hypothetical protein